MITLPEHESRTRRAETASLWLLIGLEVGALLLYVVYDAAGVELAARTGAGVREIGSAAVVVTTTLVSAAALVLWWWLRRRENGMRTWSVVAGAVWAASFLGPLGAPDGESMLALATFHVLVGGGIFFGVRRIEDR
jgi:hypothetical protein